MNKTIERLITAGLIAILIGALAWQWAYGTNDSSYRFGYNMILEKSKCIATQVRTDSGDDCDRAILATTWVCGDPNDINADKAFDPHNAVTNETACADGVANGFVHWCSGDQLGCQAVMKRWGVEINTPHITQNITIHNMQ